MTDQANVPANHNKYQYNIHNSMTAILLSHIKTIEICMLDKISHPIPDKVSFWGAQVAQTLRRQPRRPRFSLLLAITTTLQTAVIAVNTLDKV